MSLTQQQARDSLLAFFLAGWQAGGAVVEGVELRYADVKQDAPRGVSWARVTVQHATSGQASLADQSNKKIFTRNGVLTVQLFTVYGDGLKKADALTKVVQDTFEGKATSDGIWFRDVRANEIGQDGEWHQTNVLVEFTYDEVK